jgi:DNA repair protein RadC
MENKTSQGLKVIRLQVVKETIQYYGPKKIRSPADVEEVVRAFIGNADREIFLALNLSSANNINSIHIVSIGTLNQSIVHPRECFKAALLSNAEAVVFAHNHPSGEVIPSAEDKQITIKLKECGQILNIRVLDHVIVGENAHFSFQESGLL